MLTSSRDVRLIRFKWIQLVKSKKKCNFKNLYITEFKKKKKKGNLKNLWINIKNKIKTEMGVCVGCKNSSWSFNFSL